MNHRRSPRGYHSRLLPGMVAAALFPACVPTQVAAPQAPPRLLAVSATVVVEAGTLPPELAFWYQLGRTLDRPSRGEP